MDRDYPPVNKPKKQFLVLSILPTVLATVFALITTIRHPQVVDIITASGFLGLSLGVWILILVRANSELFAPLERLAETQKRSRRLEDALSQMESVARQEQDKLDAAQRHFARESTCISQVAMATRAPLKSLIGFTNLLVSDDSDDHDRCLYELERTGKQLAFLTGMLYERREDQAATQFCLPQMLDDVLACIYPMVNARGCEIYPLLTETCPDQIHGIEPHVKAAVFHYLLWHLADSVIENRTLHLEVNYSNENDLIFVLTPVEEAAREPGVRFRRVLKDCNAILEDSLMAIPVDSADEPPPFSGRHLKAIVVDDNETRSRSLMSRLGHLGIELVEPSERHMADICFAGSYDEPAAREALTRHSLPTMILDSTIPVTESSVIRLRKPIDHTELIAAIEKSVSVRPSPRKGEVLAVDDSPANLRLTAMLLEELGYMVHTAGNGHEAVRLAEQRQFDFIVMDVRMPVLDGLQAASAIRKMKGKHLSIIGLSAHVTEQERARIRSAGMNDVVDKPLTRAKLEAVLSRYAPEPAIVAQDQDGIPLFDEEQGLKLANDNPDLANELFRLLVFSLPEDRNKIDKAWRHNDQTLFRAAIHKLNGAARYCGIPRLAAAIDELESLAKSGTNADIAAAMETFNEEIDALLAWHQENPDPFGVHITPRGAP